MPLAGRSHALSREAPPLRRYPWVLRRKYWTPNVGCNIRISLATGIPEYDECVKSISWFHRAGLRFSLPDGSIGYRGGQTRPYPKAI